MKNNYLKRGLAFVLTLAMLLTSNSFTCNLTTVKAAEEEITAPKTDESEDASGNLGDESDEPATSAGDETEDAEKNVADSDANGDITDDDVTNDEANGEDKDEAKDDTNNETDGEVGFEAQVTYDTQSVEAVQPLYDGEEISWSGVAFSNKADFDRIQQDMDYLWGNEEREIDPYEGEFEGADSLDELFSAFGNGAEYAYIEQYTATLPDEVSPVSITIPSGIKGLIIGSGWYEEEGETEAIEGEDGEGEGNGGYNFGVIANELTIAGAETYVYLQQGLYVDARGDFTIKYSGSEQNNSKVFLRSLHVNGSINCDDSFDGGTIVLEEGNILNGYVNKGRTEFNGYGQLLIRDTTDSNSSSVIFGDIVGKGNDVDIVYNGYPENESQLPHFLKPFDLGTVIEENDGNEDGNENEDGYVNQHEGGITLRFWERQPEPFGLDGIDYGEEGWWDKVPAEDLKPGTQIVYFGEDEDSYAKKEEIAGKVSYYKHRLEGEEEVEEDYELTINPRTGQLWKNTYRIRVFESKDKFDEVKKDFYPDYNPEDYENPENEPGIWGGSWEDIAILDDTVLKDLGQDAYVAIQAKKDPYNLYSDEFSLPDNIKGAVLLMEWGDEGEETLPWHISSLTVKGDTEVYINNVLVDQIAEGQESEAKGLVVTAQSASSSITFENVEINGDLDFKAAQDVSFLSNTYVKGNVDGGGSSITIRDNFIANGLTGCNKLTVSEHATFIVNNVSNTTGVAFKDIDLRKDEDGDASLNILYNGYPDEDTKLPVFSGTITVDGQGTYKQEEDHYVGIGIRFIESQDKEFWESPDGWDWEEDGDYDWWQLLEDKTLNPGAPIAATNPTLTDGEKINTLLSMIQYFNESEDFEGAELDYTNDGWIVIKQFNGRVPYRVLRLDADQFSAAKEDLGKTIWEELGDEWQEVEVEELKNILESEKYVAIQASAASHNLADKNLTIPINVEGAFLVSDWDDDEERSVPWQMTSLTVEGNTELYISGIIIDPSGQMIKGKTFVLNSQSENADIIFKNTEVIGNLELSSRAKIVSFHSDTRIRGSLDVDASDASITIRDNLIVSAMAGCDKITIDGHANLIVDNPAGSVHLYDVDLNKDENDETSFNVLYIGYPGENKIPDLSEIQISIDGTDVDEVSDDIGIGIRFVENDDDFWLAPDDWDWEVDGNYDWWQLAGDVILAPGTKIAKVAANLGKADADSLMSKLWYITEDEDCRDVWTEYKNSGYICIGGYGVPFRVLQFENEDEYNQAKADTGILWNEEPKEGEEDAYRWEDAGSDSLEDFLKGVDADYVAIHAKKTIQFLESKTVTLPANIQGAMLVSRWDNRADSWVSWKINELNVGSDAEGDTGEGAEVYIINTTIEPKDEITGDREFIIKEASARSEIHFVESEIIGSLKGENTSVTIQGMFIAQGFEGCSKLTVNNYASFIVSEPTKVVFGEVEIKESEDYDGDVYFDLLYNGYPADNNKLPVFNKVVTAPEGKGIGLRFIESPEGGAFWVPPADWDWEEDGYYDWWQLSNDAGLEAGASIAKTTLVEDGDIDSLLGKIWYTKIDEDYYGAELVCNEGGWIVIDKFLEEPSFNVLIFDAEQFEKSKYDIDTLWNDELGSQWQWMWPEYLGDFLQDEGVEYVAIQARTKSHDIGNLTLTLPGNIQGAMLVSGWDEENDMRVPWKLNKLVVEGETDVFINGICIDYDSQEVDDNDQELTVDYQGLNIDAQPEASITFFESDILGTTGDITVSGDAKIRFQNSDVVGSVKAKNVEIEDMFTASGLTDCENLVVTNRATFIVNNPKGLAFNDIELIKSSEETDPEADFYLELIYNGYPENASLLPVFKKLITFPEKTGISIRFAKKQSGSFWDTDGWWDKLQDEVLTEGMQAAATTLTEEDAGQLLKQVWYNTHNEEYRNKFSLDYEAYEDREGGKLVLVKNEQPEGPEEPEEPVDPNIKPVITVDHVLFPGKKAAYEAIYTGEQIRPVMVVTYTYADEKGKTRSQKLKLNVDYTLTYSNNVNANTGAEDNKAVVAVKGIGEYSGTVKKEFTIKPKSIAKVKLSPVGDIMYTEGKEPDPVVVVTDGTYELVEGVDYEINSPEKGSPTADTQAVLTVEGKGNYTGTSKSKAKFNILAPIDGNSEIKSINDEKVQVELKMPAKGYTYNGKQQKPKVVVTYDGKKVPASQYKVIYNNNVNACSKDDENAAAVRVVGVTKKGKGYYGVTAPFTFDIGKKDFSKVKVASIPNIPLTGKVSDITLTVKDGKHILTEDEEFTVDYNTIRNANGSIVDTIVTGQKYTITLKPVTGKNYTDTPEKKVNVKFGQLNLASKTAKMTVTIKDPTQNKVEVVYNGVTLTGVKDYTATVKQDKNKPTYTVTIKAVKKSAYKGKKVFKNMTFTPAAEPTTAE